MKKYAKWADSATNLYLFKTENEPWKATANNQVSNEK